MTISRSVLAVGLVAAGASQPLSAASIYLQDVGGNPGFTFEGSAVTQATFDDTMLQTGGSASTLAANFGNSSSMQIRTTSSGLVNFAVLAVKDLFTLLPATDGLGGTLAISSATLHLASSGSSQPTGYTINVRRVTTDWLANPAGNNEGRASGNQRNGTNTNPVTGGASWVGGNFGGANYTATNAALNQPFANSTYGAYIGTDVTGIVNDMYSNNANYGFSISTSYVANDLVSIRSSEDTLLPGTFETFRPVLELNYEYVAAVPEPMTTSLLGLAVVALLGRRTRSA